MSNKYITVTTSHIYRGIAGSDTHCPISLAVVDTIDKGKAIYLRVAVDCHTPNFFKKRLGQKPNEPMRYSIKIEKFNRPDYTLVYAYGNGPEADDTQFIMLDQEVTDWIKRFDSGEWLDNDRAKRLEPITIEVYDDDGITHGRMFDERYQINKK